MKVSQSSRFDAEREGHTIISVGEMLEVVKHYDVVVVGCGAMGSAVTYNLAGRGLKVLTLESFGLNHEFGSSHGKTRIIRLAYFEDPRYVPLLRRAFDSWDELQAKSGRRILMRNGGLMIGQEDGPLLSGVLRSAKAHALPYELLGAREAVERFRAFRLEEEYSAVYEENAGILFPEECIAGYTALAKESGTTIGFTEPLIAWRRRTDGIEVESSKDRYVADRIVFAAGAWTGRLLPGLIPLTCERQVPLWFSPGGGDSFSADRMPVFIMEEADGHYFYGIPDVGHGVKVARTHEGQIVDPDKVERTVTEADVLPVRRFVRKRFPTLKPDPISSTTCLYTNTPDQNFVVDFHPEDRRAFVISACSGHGFKFSSVIGEIVADLLVDGRTGFDISFLNAGRFAGRSGGSPGSHQVP